MRCPLTPRLPPKSRRRLRQNERTADIHPEQLVEVVQGVVEDGVAGDHAGVTAHRGRVAAKTLLDRTEGSLDVRPLADVCLEVPDAIPRPVILRAGDVNYIDGHDCSSATGQPRADVLAQGPRPAAYHYQFAREVDVIHRRPTLVVAALSQPPASRVPKATAKGDCSPPSSGCVLEP